VKKRVACEQQLLSKWGARKVVVCELVSAMLQFPPAAPQQGEEVEEGADSGDDDVSLASSTVSISVKMTKAAVLQRTLKWAGYKQVDTLDRNYLTEL